MVRGKRRKPIGLTISILMVVVTTAIAGWPTVSRLIFERRLCLLGHELRQLMLSPHHIPASDGHAVVRRLELLRDGFKSMFQRRAVSYDEVVAWLGEPSFGKKGDCELEFRYNVISVGERSLLVWFTLEGTAVKCVLTERPQERIPLDVLKELKDDYRRTLQEWKLAEDYKSSFERKRDLYNKLRDSLLKTASLYGFSYRDVVEILGMPDRVDFSQNYDPRFNDAVDVMNVRYYFSFKSSLSSVVFPFQASRQGLAFAVGGGMFDVIF